VSESRIRRAASVVTATVGTSTTDATAFQMEGMVGGIVTFGGDLPTAASLLTFYASAGQAGPFVQLFDRDGAAVAVTLTTAATVAYALPYEVGGCGWVRIVSNATLGTAAAVRVGLKG
jgi:hypothetical protein